MGIGNPLVKSHIPGDEFHKKIYFQAQTDGKSMCSWDGFCLLFLLLAF